MFMLMQRVSRIVIAEKKGMVDRGQVRRGAKTLSERKMLRATCPPRQSD
jgi:hypothetical protein